MGGVHGLGVRNLDGEHRPAQAYPFFTGTAQGSFQGTFLGPLTGNVTGNVGGTAASLSAASALPSGTTATTQAAADSSTKVATTAYADAAAAARAAKGANSDITSLSGLTTALTVVQGGTGSSSQNFVDLSTVQTIDGAKSFSAGIVVQGMTVGLGGGAGITSVAIGGSALQNNTAAAIYNTAVGNSALLSNTTGNYNTALGFMAGSSLVSGSENVFMGMNANTTALEANNQIAIGSGAMVNGANKAVIGNSSVTTVGGYGAWTNYSDLREKENIQGLALGLDFVLKLRPVIYNYLSQPGVLREGLIAQEVEAAATSLGATFHGLDRPATPDGRYSLSYPSLVMPLINAVKELKAENDALKAEVELLKSQMAQVLARLPR